MFTGIVEEVGKVRSVQPGKLAVSADIVLQDMEPGVSISVNGVCLTVTAFDTGSFVVDIMPETLKRSNLVLLKTGDRVNLERAMALGGRLGGHLVQGHIDAVGKVASMTGDSSAVLVDINAPPEVMRYIVEKGFIAVDGISLTVTGRSSTSFRVSVVEYTRTQTVLGYRRVGDVVNLEVDIIAKYIEALSRPQNTGISPEFLREHGFAIG